MKYGFTVPNNFGVVDRAEVVGLAVEAEELGVDACAAAQLGLATWCGTKRASGRCRSHRGPRRQWRIRRAQS